MIRVHRLGVGLFALALFAAGCGNEEAEGSVQAYCDMVASFDEQDSMPSEEQLEELKSIAPAEIAEEIALVADAMIADGTNAFGDPAVAGAMGDVIEPWEEEHCPQTDGDGEEESEPEPQEPAEGATPVEVVAKDLRFQLPETVPSGKVAFILRNEDTEAHHLDLVRFKDGTTVEDVEAAFQDGNIDELFDEQLGTSSDAAPGETAVLNAELSPGLYGMACFVENADGVSHYFDGMRSAFEVS